MAKHFGHSFRYININYIHSLTHDLGLTYFSAAKIHQIPHTSKFSTNFFIIKDKG